VERRAGLKPSYRRAGTALLVALGLGLALAAPTSADDERWEDVPQERWDDENVPHERWHDQRFHEDDGRRFRRHHRRQPEVQLPPSGATQPYWGTTQPYWGTTQPYWGPSNAAPQPQGRTLHNRRPR